MQILPKHKIKILIFTPSLECGGSEKYVSVLCNNINTEKFAVTLAVLNNTNQFYQISNPAIKVIDLKKNRVLYSFFKIRNTVIQIQPDIIFSNANHLNLYFAIFKNFLAPKITIIARESSIVSINSKRAEWPLLYNGLVRHFYKRLHCIICQSQYMQQDLVTHYNIQKEKTSVISNAVEKNILPTQAPQPRKFITVARLSEEKGIERIIRSVAKLSIPFSYYIIGDGPEREKLNALTDSLQMQNNIFFEGKKKEPYRGMEDASLFLMGSYYEGFPNSLLEAGALGIPVVVFDAPGGIKEIIKDGENGYLVKDNDEGAFAFAIEKAINTNFNRDKIAAATLTKYSISETIKKTEALFTASYLLSKTRQ